jgi:hypothetical protein
MFPKGVHEGDADSGGRAHEVAGGQRPEHPGHGVEEERGHGHRGELPEARGSDRREQDPHGAADVDDDQRDPVLPHQRGQARGHEDADHAEHVGDRGEPTGGDVRAAERAHHRRHPEAEAVDPDRRGEEQQSEHPHVLRAQRSPRVRVRLLAELRAILLELVLDPVGLGGGDPRGGARGVPQPLQGGHRGDHRGEARDHEQPVPSAQPQPVQTQDGAGERAHDEEGDRCGEHEGAGRLRAVALREPEGQVVEHARVEAGLGDAQQEAQHVEDLGRRRQRRERRDQAPGEQDPCEPDARPHLGQQVVRGHLEQEVGQEEQSGAESEGGVAQADVRGHLQLRVADHGAVDVGDGVQHHHEGDDVPGDLRDQCALVDGRGRVHDGSSGAGPATGPGSGDGQRGPGACPGGAGAGGAEGKGPTVGSTGSGRRDQADGRLVPRGAGPSSRSTSRMRA